ncbi:MAG: hypothetical protein JJU34_07020 [Lunatimonas sp.]|uniref:hypothetical protein n=1 Tax=Lunatimonas sp. TaxID=2060141 RepID=UPI00263A46AF|nr:hypothetical protein [Lunatimonas sp.]MCC5937014.1 hypothetical protein [Lunatimonas sp.]
MAIPTPSLISSIRKTAQRLKNGSPYQWGHMGACNCGNLAQELTNLNKGEIHQLAMQGVGDWNDQLREYCPSSGFPMDIMISKLLEAGLSLDDLADLEKLSNPAILAEIPIARRNHLSKNNRNDVVLYMETWANLLERQWITLNALPNETAKKKINQFTILS